MTSFTQSEIEEVLNTYFKIDGVTSLHWDTKTLDHNGNYIRVKTWAAKTNDERVFLRDTPAEAVFDAMAALVASRLTK